jgi:hypothetical protein
MDEIWRMALKDSTYPLHKATSLLFAQSFNVKMAAKILAHQKEEVIEYLYQILDTEELFWEESFGTGYGTIHAVELIGE